MGKTYRKRRTRKKRCKHGKLKRSVRTKSGRKRRCKKRKSRKRKRKSRKRKYKMDYQGPRGGCPPGMVEDIKNCGYVTPCKDQNGICKTKRGKRLSEVMSLQELATRRLLKQNTKTPAFTLNYNLPKQPPLAPKGYYLTSPTYPGKFDIRSIHTMNDMEERNRVTKELSDLLMQESWKGNTEEVISLIKAGADVNAKGKYDDTALIEASGRGNTEIVDLLIKAGADVNNKNKYGHTALIEASGREHTEIVDLLIDAGANINEQARGNGHTALMYASKKGHTDVVELLQQRGAKVNTEDEEGNTALIEASYRGYTDIVELLIKARADVNIKNKYGYTALDYARGNQQIADLLLQHGAT
tara:strand:- start:132 stop:1202 length:1071 start_codon:yes stop_codon:yes gene_type:complete